MRIGLIGGLDRLEGTYTAMAAAAGHELFFHTGKMGGRGSKGVERVIDHADVVVIVTEVNSHDALYLSRRLLRERGRTPILLRKCGTARFAALLAEITARESVAHVRPAG